MKKPLLVFLGVFLLLGFVLTGCGSNSSSNGSGKPITINLYDVGGDSTYFNNYLIPMFEKKYKGKYKVQYASGKWQEIVNKIKAQGKKGNIDIVGSGLDGIPGGAKQGVWMQLYPKYSKQIHFDELTAPAQAYVKNFNGFGAPYYVSLGGPALEYNSKTMPNPPTTYPQLLAWIKAHPGKFEYATVPTSGPGRGFFFGLTQYLGEDMTDPSSLTKTWSTLADLSKDIPAYPASSGDTFKSLQGGSLSLVPHLPGWFAQQYSQGAVPDGYKIVTIQGVKQVLDAHLYAIPNNLSDARQKAALDFINFATSAEANAYAYEGMGVPANSKSTVDMLSADAKATYEKGLTVIPDQFKKNGQLVIPDNDWVLFPKPDPLLKEYNTWQSKIQAKK